MCQMMGCFDVYVLVSLRFCIFMLFAMSVKPLILTKLFLFTLQWHLGCLDCESADEAATSCSLPQPVRRLWHYCELLGSRRFSFVLLILLVLPLRFSEMLLDFAALTQSRLKSSAVFILLLKQADIDEGRIPFSLQYGLFWSLFIVSSLSFALTLR